MTMELVAGKLQGCWFMDLGVWCVLGGHVREFVTFKGWGEMAWDGWLASNWKGGDVMLDG